MIAGSTRLKAGTATKMVLNMLTTIAMIKRRQDLRQPDGRRADRIREAEGSRPAHRRASSPASTTMSRTRCSSARSWNVKAAIVMQKAGLTLPQAIAASRRPTTRCAKRSAKTSSRGCVSSSTPEERRLRAIQRSAQFRAPPRRAKTSTSTVQLQERRRAAAVVIGPCTHASMHCLRPSRSRAGRSAAREGSSPSPSTAPPSARARGRRRTAPHCCAGSTAFRRDAMSPPASSRAGSLKPMWPLVPMPSNCISMPPASAMARS